MKKLWWILLIPYLTLMALMTRRHNSVTAIREFRIAKKVPNGISFYRDVICISDKAGLKFFQAKCTHLGCRINKSEDGRLICPCHGSEFNMDVKAIKDPANKALQELAYSVDNNTNELIIKLV